MKFEYFQACQCGGTYRFEARGDESFEYGECSSCGATAHLFDSLSVSVVSERLLHRSKLELDRGDYTLTILLAAIAVETFLTRLFMKLKGMEKFASSFHWPTESDETAWGKKYPRSGGFIGPANFVAKQLVKMGFDQFVVNNATAKAVSALAMKPVELSLAETCQTELFRLRNRIAHWGFVNSTEAEATRCHEIALAVVGVLREMDRVRYANV